MYDLISGTNGRTFCSTNADILSVHPEITGLPSNNWSGLMLCFLHKLGLIGELPEEAMLCAINVVGLYPHIPRNEGFGGFKPVQTGFTKLQNIENIMYSTALHYLYSAV